MYKEEIITICKQITRQSAKQNKEMAQELGVTATRFSALIGQGDMKLSSFIKLLEVCGYQMEISPSENGEVLKLLNRNKCNECTYKKVANSLDDSIQVKVDEKTNKFIIEG